MKASGGRKGSSHRGRESQAVVWLPDIWENMIYTGGAKGDELT